MGHILACDIPSTYYESFGMDNCGELVDLDCQSQWYPIVETYTGYGLVAVLASKWPGDQFLPLSCTFLAKTFKMIPLACIVPCQKHLLIVAIVTQGTVPSLLVSVRGHCTIQRMRIGLYDLHPLGRALSGFVTFLQQIMTIHLLLLTHIVFS